MPEIKSFAGPGASPPPLDPQGCARAPRRASAAHAAAAPRTPSKPSPKPPVRAATIPRLSRPAHLRSINHLAGWSTTRHNHLFLTRLAPSLRLTRLCGLLLTVDSAPCAQLRDPVKKSRVPPARPLVHCVRVSCDVSARAGRLGCRSMVAAACRRRRGEEGSIVPALGAVRGRREAVAARRSDCGALCRWGRLTLSSVSRRLTLESGL